MFLNIHCCSQPYADPKVCHLDQVNNLRIHCNKYQMHGYYTVRTSADLGSFSNVEPGKIRITFF